MKNSWFGSANKTRKPYVAGKFYPDSKQELWNELNQLYASARPLVNIQQALQAIVAPHAGYIFSGTVAASAFNQIPPNASYKKIFIIASSHQFNYNGAAVFTSGNYETPLGEVEVSVKTGKEILSKSEVFIEKDEAHNFEHSLEVLLPFLQKKITTPFKIIPLILGTSKASDCKEIAQALQPYFHPDNLFVISSDFSHYPNYKDACEIDNNTAEAICSNNPELLLSTLRNNRNRGIKNLATSLCGWASVLTLLHLSENKDCHISKIDYKNSGDAEPYGDKSKVVGYCALAVYNKNKAKFEISEKQKSLLIGIAKKKVSSFVKEEKQANDGISENEILNQKIGVFVSIYIKSKLRGCVGGFPQEKTLIQLISEMSVSAACDSRFEKPSPDELNDMEVEISLISPLRKIKTIDEIELGKHGIYIKSGFSTGTFLPQVAIKTGWDLHELLGHCSRDKAGIGWDGWKTAEIFTYEAFVFRG